MVQVGQEECPLLPTEDLLLFRIDSKRIKKDRSHWKQGHSNSIPLVIKNSKRIEFVFKEEKKNGRYQSSEQGENEQRIQ